MGTRSWSSVILRHVVFWIVMVTFATGMALTSGSDTSNKEPAMAAVGTAGNPWRPYYISHACEWTFLTIACPAGRVLSVVRANYGRQDLNYCPHMKPRNRPDLTRPCSGSIRKTRRIVSSMCNGKTRCTLPVYNGMFGDPCPNTHKYLEVYYACVDT